MSWSSGPGSPVSFRCSKCRQKALGMRAGDPGGPDVYHGGRDVTLTGKERPYRTPRCSASGVRSDSVSRQYTCDDCGHVGWSNHIELSMRRFKDHEKINQK